MNEDYIPARLWLAGVLGDQGRYPEESLVLEQAMTRDPLNELLVVNYANNLSTRGEWPKGKELLQDLLALRPDSTILLRFMAKQELYNGNLVEGWKLANRAYQLQPDNPEDIASLARTWILLGDTAEAERLLLEGLEASAQNASLQEAMWMVLVVNRRFEEADRQLREMMAEFGEDMPPGLLRNFNFQLGLLAMMDGDYATARDKLMSALGEDENAAWGGNEIMILSMAALANERLGESAVADELLQRAERRIHRARLNGVDDPNIYYNEGVLDSLRGDDEDRLNEDVTRALAEIRSLPIAFL